MLIAFCTQTSFLQAFLGNTLEVSQLNFRFSIKIEQAIGAEYSDLEYIYFNCVLFSSLLIWIRCFLNMLSI